MSEPTVTVNPVVRGVALSAIVAVAAALAVLLHRNGHTQGDDFALYLRQARSLFDGDIAQVVSDNRFAVLNSDSGFSPIAYPWVWPLLLSPFVHLWGLDYDRLKLVEVAAFCLWLVLLHSIVRRRIGWWPAIAIVAVFATAPTFLSHTDQLLTEFPHLAAVALVIWWYDRIRRDATLLNAPIQRLAVLGALVALAFNVRRESVVLLGVVAVMMLYDVVGEHAGRFVGRPVVPTATTIIGASWRAMVAPFAAFAVTATLSQLLLPTDLLPDNGNSSSFIDDRMGEYPGILSDQLGLGEHTAIGIGVLVVAAIGVVIGLRRRPALDGPLALLAVLSALVVSTHPRRVDRYWFQVTPWVVFFATVALLSLGAWALSRRTRVASALALTPLGLLVVAHLAVLPGDISDAQHYNDAGRVQSGPSNPAVTPIFDAVNTLTAPDAIIAYYRARTMTLMTDRRSFQTKNLERIERHADYYAERRNSTYWQPELSQSSARAAGFEEVWSNERWTLWRLPDKSNP
jgi:hypothetical protein